MLLSQHIKENTKESHQKLEGIVVRQLKAIQSRADYARVLKVFYAYFHVVEQAIAPFVNVDILPDYHTRRNSSDIKRDIEALGSHVDNVPRAHAPTISNTLEALSALYVLEGSIMGGPYIVQMLNKYGISEGTSFFAGYGTDTSSMWATFVGVLNKFGENPATHLRASAIANETFSKFGDVFAAHVVA
ncbi:biliverdin-producing heme oxygenase [Sphingobacterium griseoflavum]|uniref:Heme oxygenase n=1 Tax=Sphingobacterium griseoflavum TaxID=1474952 RepID=A0ABQ3HZ85_9SPHI|nr:biliverdin-producing heme oxygenase [Sphingobacterium griseoflavum]GHE42456.1 heme oxygenase [Sphingobacterium griseoflavum]